MRRDTGNCPPSSPPSTRLPPLKLAFAICSRNHDAKPGSSARLSQDLLLSWQVVTSPVVAYVIATKHGRRACAGSRKLVVDLELAAARKGPHDYGAARTVDSPGEQEVEKRSQEENPTKKQ